MIPSARAALAATWRRTRVTMAKALRAFRRKGAVGVLRSGVRRAIRSFVEYHAHATFKTRAAALIGMIGFPVFYVVWSYLFPQPYENAGLRAIGFVLSTLVFLVARSPDWLRAHGVALSYVTLWFTVPFFFTFMLLMNEANTVWQLSLVSGFVYLVLLCDPINAFIQGFTGSLAAFLAFWLVTGGQALPVEYLSVLPVLAFVLCGVAFLNYSNNLIINDKMAAMGGLAAHIAHEMRTPLLGIRLDADKVQKLLPDLIDAWQWARKNGWPGRIPPSMQSGLPDALTRIRHHTLSANSVIDMLLMNAAVTKGRAEMKPCSARKAVEEAIERYHFRAGQRELVDLDVDDDFTFEGVEVLTVHVLFNLLKNALRAIEKADKGRISITLRRGPQFNEIVFRDSGPGMAPEVARKIFLPFYSNEAIGIGTGIGLAFCRSVVESFDGVISCSSELGVGTEFVMGFPDSALPTPAAPTGREGPSEATSAATSPRSETRVIAPSHSSRA